MVSLVPRISFCLRHQTKLLSKAAVTMKQQQQPMEFSTSTNLNFEDSSDLKQRKSRDTRFFNQVTLLGRVGKNPVLVGREGIEVSFFPLATVMYYPAENNEVIEDKQWHDIMVTNKNESMLYFVTNKLRKGDRVYVEGTLKYRRVEDFGNYTKETRVVADEMIFLEGGKE